MLDCSRSEPVTDPPVPVRADVAQHVAVVPGRLDARHIGGTARVLRHLAGALVEHVVDAQRRTPARTQFHATGEIGHQHRRLFVLHAVVQALDRAVVGEVDVRAPAPFLPAQPRHLRVAGRTEAQRVLAALGQQVDVRQPLQRRRNVADLLDGGAPHVGRIAPAQLAPHGFLVGLQGQLDTACAGIAHVGEVAGIERITRQDADAGRTQQRIDGVLLRRSQHRAAVVGDARWILRVVADLAGLAELATDVDLVGIHGQVERRARVPGHAQAVVGGFLGLQRRRTQRNRRRRRHLRHQRGAARAAAGGLVVLRAQAGRVETVADRGTHAQRVGEVEARGQAAGGDTAEVGVIFPARGRIQIPARGDIGGRAHIDRLAVAGSLHRVRSGIADEGRSTKAGIRLPLPRPTFVLFVLVLGTCAHFQRRGERSHLEATAQVEVGDTLLVVQLAVVEVGRRTGVWQRVVHRVAGIGAHRAAVAGKAGVVVPACDLAFHARGAGVLLLLGFQHREEAIGKHAQHAWSLVSGEDGRRQTEVLDRLRGAVTGRSVSVELRAFAQAMARIHCEGLQRIRWRTEDGVGLGIAVGLGRVRRCTGRQPVVRTQCDQVAVGIHRRIAQVAIDVTAGTDRVVLPRGLAGQVDEAIGTPRQAHIGTHAGSRAIAINALPAFHGKLATVRLRLQDHVDHTGNRIGAINGRRTITQHFHMVDGRHRNQRQVGPGVAWEAAAVGTAHIGTGIAALSVHQHQRVAGRQVAQLVATDQALLVALVATNLAERRQCALQCFQQVGLAGRGEVFGGDHVDRRGTVLHRTRTGAGAGHHHGIQRGRGHVGRRGGGSGIGIGFSRVARRRGQNGSDQDSKGAQDRGVGGRHGGSWGWAGNTLPFKGLFTRGNRRDRVTQPSYPASHMIAGNDVRQACTARPWHGDGQSTLDDVRRGGGDRRRSATDGVESTVSRLLLAIPPGSPRCAR
ncbi:hypothetical protein BN126350134 [Stenotrophomonas thermophila]|nr:hypothetical protein BN126350134 [Stenotrophomonas maltophilia]